jgi:hypothetical protein
VPAWGEPKVHPDQHIGEASQNSSHQDGRRTPNRLQRLPVGENAVCDA